jgi:hypothetical protein
LQGRYWRVFAPAHSFGVAEVDMFKAHSHTTGARYFGGGTYAHAMRDISDTTSSGSTSAVGGSETRPVTTVLAGAVKF